MAYTKTKSFRKGYSKKGYYKCKTCYSKGSFCTHQGGSRSTRRTKGAYGNYNTRSRFTKRTFAKASLKRRTMKDLVKVEAPVMVPVGVDEDGDPTYGEVPDQLPLDGVRVRVTRLTHLNPVQNECKDFQGKVVFSGVTDDFRFELIGEGPFLHRRIVFRSVLPYPSKAFEWCDRVDLQNRYRREPASSLDDADACTVVLRLVGMGATVRSMMFGKVVAPGLSVVEDKLAQYEGKASGARRAKKYYNALGKNKRGECVKYTLSSGGGYRTDLAGEDAGHLYVADFFQYGMNGLDVPVPVPGLEKASEVSSSKKPKVKGEKSSDSEDYDAMRIDQSGKPQRLSVRERADVGVVKIWANTKLYFYLPKAK